MEKIKSLSQKQPDGSFSQAIPLGAVAKNIDLKEGVNLEQKILDMVNKINGKAPINHASNAGTYGLADTENYGHVKVTDNYTTEETDSQSTVITQKAMVEIYNNFLMKILQVFYVVDNNTLYSVFSTAWQVESNALRLLPDYFSLEALDDGHYKMTVKNIHGQIIE